MDAVTLALIKSLSNNGGSGSLPPVTPEDNGKVLGVVNGAWAADSNLFVVNVALNSSYILVADKTYAEISAAIDAGKQVVCVRDGNVYTFASKTSSYIYFAVLRPHTAVIYIAITSNNNVISDSQGQLPQASAQNNGSEMIVKNGSWTMQKKKFIVTLTPTALDYSGTMDKTVAEINAAYEAGMEIWFRVYAGTSYSDVPLARYGKASGYSYPSFNVNFLYDEAGVLVLIYTGTTDDGTRQTYSTKVYALTPAS